MSMSLKYSNGAVGVCSLGDSNIHISGTITVSSTAQEFSLPPLSKTFAGRDEEMKQLASLFFNEDETKIQNKIVISGDTGVGKSELAKQFANKYEDEEDIEEIYWINSDNEDKLKTSIKTLYKYSKGMKCLFILDKVVSKESIINIDLLDEHLYLITSQSNDWDDIKMIELNQFAYVPTGENDNLSSNSTTDN